ncbi:hypothetical protein HDV00_000641 [Rhizophlyctis rosea]|nr:hypothetical protein HDV00_000641 [Rhizophlyctis rosea]
MSEILWNSIQNGLYFGIHQILDQFQVTANAGEAPVSYTATQFSTTFVQQARPTFTNLLQAVYVLGLGTIVSIVGFILWALATIRVRNARNCSMLLGTLVLIVQLTSLTHSIIAEFRTGVVVGIWASLNIPIICGSCIIRSLKVILDERKRRWATWISLGCLAVYAVVITAVVFKAAVDDEHIKGYLEP